MDHPQFSDYFETQVREVLTPVVIRKKGVHPFLENRGLYLVVELWPEFEPGFAILEPEYGLVPIPAGVVRAGAKVLERLGVTPPGASGLPLTRVVQLALEENPYQSRRLRDELGWDPTHRHHDALRRTGEWLKGAM